MTDFTNEQLERIESAFKKTAGTHAWEGMLSRLRKPQEPEFAQDEIGIIVTNEGKRVPVISGDPSYIPATHKQNQTEVGPGWVPAAVADALRKIADQVYQRIDSGRKVSAKNALYESLGDALDSYDAYRQGVKGE